VGVMRASRAMAAATAASPTRSPATPGSPLGTRASPQTPLAGAYGSGLITPVAAAAAAAVTGPVTPTVAGDDVVSDDRVTVLALMVLRALAAGGTDNINGTFPSLPCVVCAR
jgi:hypothetical protein